MMADIPVNIRLHPGEVIASGETFQLDLREFFQRYPDPGPVATFQLRMPVEDGWMEVDPGTGLLSPLTTDIEEVDPRKRFMTYKTLTGETYDNVVGAFPEDLVWKEETIEFQLRADVVPLTVANFMAYVTDGAYLDTFFHRKIYNAIQGGSYVLTDHIDVIATRPPIRFEGQLDNSPGTLAMARTNDLDSATSGFFINTIDNTEFYGSDYTVFGELLDYQADMPLVEELGHTYAYSLAADLTPTIPNQYSPFNQVPLYTPYWDDPASYIKIPSITVSQGNPEGISYNWEWAETGQAPRGALLEEANRAVFDVQLNGNSLTVARSGTGTATIRITGESDGAEAGFTTRLVAYHPEALERFPDGIVHLNGWMESPWFGWLVADSYPYLLHRGHGFLYVADAGSPDRLFLYTYWQDGGGYWFYTTPEIYPYLYVYHLEDWFLYDGRSIKSVDLAREIEDPSLPE